MTMQSSAVSKEQVRVGTAGAHWAALGVLLFGLVVLYAVGFSSLPRAHNAAHDTRHAQGFPCH
jgi:cobalt transporter subunit CbtB